MSSNDPAHLAGKTLEGRRFQPTNPEELRSLVNFAFDYRGDVTLELDTGEVLEGYVYDRNDQMPSPSLKVFPKDQEGTRVVLYEHVVSIFFSGEDTAFGKSWDDWVNKMQKISAKKEST